MGLLEFISNYSLLILVIIFCQIKLLECKMNIPKKPQDVSIVNVRQRSLDLSSMNQKVVGIMLKTNGRRYYVSSELCPGGIFLTRPVNENCLCYNGIFQVVRDCCEPLDTSISADHLEWRMDYKCGVSAEKDKLEKPIRAILPLTSTYNRHGSIVMLQSLSGNNVSQWRRYDLDDVIIRNAGEVSMTGEKSIEIVNVKPLGREIKISFGFENDTVSVCYSGWFVKSSMNLKIVANVTGKMKGCCFQISESNTPGDVNAECTSGYITTELVEVPTTDMDIGQCEDDVPEEAIHKIKKRNLYLGALSTNPFKRDFENNVQNMLGDQGQSDPSLPRATLHENRDITIRTKRQNKNDDGSDSGATLKVVIPRKKGIAFSEPIAQAKAIAEFVAILRNDPNFEIEEPKTYRYQLLKKSVDVFLSIIPDEIVPHVMVKTAYDVLYFLYEGLDAITYDSPDLHIQAMGYLEDCMKNSKLPLNFTTMGCPKEVDEVVITPEVKARLEQYYKSSPEELRLKIKGLKHADIKRTKRFIPDLYDIFVEINWKIIDFVHSFCFDHFQEQFNAHHFYETELEKIFLYPEVQTRWYTKQPKGLIYVKGIFPTTKLELRMKQLDKVTAIAHYLSRYNGSYWLSRPKIDPRFIKNQRISSLKVNLYSPKNLDAFNKNYMDEILTEDDLRSRKNGMTARKMGDKGNDISGERSVTYPHIIPEKLPPGEMIWDGRAICLHSSYSNEPSYYVDEGNWGVHPSLMDLGRKYQLEYD